MVHDNGNHTLKVAVFIHGREGGAFKNVGSTLVRGFRAIGVDAHLVVKTATLEELDALKDIPVVNLAASNAARAIRPLVRYLRQERPHVLLSMPNHNNFIALVAKMLSRTPAKVVVSERNNLSKDHSTYDGLDLKRRAVPWLIGFLYPRSNGITTATYGVMRDPMFRSLIDANRIPTAVIPNALRSTFALQAAERINDPWIQEDAPNDVPLLLAVGMLIPQKGFDILIDSVGILRDKSIDTRLMILGEGSLRPSLEAQIDSLGLSGQVRLAGFVPNPIPYMKSCDVFVLSSGWEGFGNVLIEAMASGCPIVSTRAPSGPLEILTENHNALMVDVGDSLQMANALEELLSKPALRSGLSRNALHDSQAYQSQSIARRYVDFFLRLLDKGEAAALSETVSPANTTPLP